MSDETSDNFFQPNLGNSFLKKSNTVIWDSDVSKVNLPSQPLLFEMIIDFSSPTKNMFVIPSGQSGHLISRHYDDQTSLWKSGDYIYLSGVRDLILGGVKGEVIIYPLSIE